jgi:hypothetical protein
MTLLILTLILCVLLVLYVVAKTFSFILFITKKPKIYVWRTFIFKQLFASLESDENADLIGIFDTIEEANAFKESLEKKDTSNV